MHIVPLFYEIDDFFLALEKYMAQRALPVTERVEKRGRPRSLYTSEVICRFSSKWVPDVQGLSRKTCQFLLAMGVSETC